MCKLVYDNVQKLPPGLHELLFHEDLVFADEKSEPQWNIMCNLMLYDSC